MSFLFKPTLPVPRLTTADPDSSQNSKSTSKYALYISLTAMSLTEPSLFVSSPGLSSHDHH